LASQIHIESRDARLTSGAVCEAAGISRGALRLYEREGLIEPPPRTSGGYRLYPDDTVDLLEAIRMVKSLGFGLAEVRDLLALLGAGETAQEELRALASRRLAAVDARIEGLRELRDCIAAYLDGDDFSDDEECAAISRLLAKRRAAPAKSKRTSR
jgi:DNA-binding transcriptional MerR regulator